MNEEEEVEEEEETDFSSFFFVLLIFLALVPHGETQKRHKRDTKETQKRKKLLNLAEEWRQTEKIVN